VEGELVVDGLVGGDDEDAVGDIEEKPGGIL
jgi:hypothetical protein